MHTPSATAILLGILVLSGLTLGCTDGPSPASEPPVLAVTWIPESTLLAADPTTGTGAPVRFSQHASGKACLAALLRGEADLATTAESPIVHALAEGQPVRILASLAMNDDMISIVADGGQDIATIHDLVGRTIAVPPGTNAVIACRSTLAFNDIDPTAVIEKAMAPDEAVEALIDGRVAAASLWSPQRDEAIDRLGDRARVFSDSAAYIASWNLVCHAERPPAQADLDRLFRHLDKNSRRLRQHPDSLAPAIAERAGLSIERAGERIASLRLGPRLDQSLLLLFEQQATVLEPDMPLIRIYEAIDPGPLVRVDPAACTIIY